jgi:hypothetical protein
VKLFIVHRKLKQSIGAANPYNISLFIEAYVFHVMNMTRNVFIALPGVTIFFPVAE